MEIVKKCLKVLFCLVFGGISLLLLGMAWPVASGGEVMGAVGMVFFGVVVLGITIVFGRMDWSTPKGSREIVGPYGSTTVGPDDSPAALAGARRAIEEPWTLRQDWMSGRIADELAGLTGKMLGVHVGVCVVMWVLLLTFQDALGFFALLPVVLTLALGGTIYVHLRARKFGTSWIEFRDVPFWMGERLHATVRTGIPLRGRAFVDVDVQLSCVKRWSSFSYDSHGTRREEMKEEVLWMQASKARGVRSPRGPVFDVPLDLALPVGLPSASIATTGDRKLWRLRVHAAEPGIDYRAAFEVPVFARGGAAQANGSGPDGHGSGPSRREHLSTDEAKSMRNWVCFSIAGFGGLLLVMAGVIGAFIALAPALILCAVAAVFFGIALLIWRLMGWRRQGARESVGSSTVNPDASPREVERAQGTGTGPNGHT